MHKLTNNLQHNYKNLQQIRSRWNSSSTKKRPCCLRLQENYARFWGGIVEL
jgi:hypothetical protein